jgi:hypothetical protein
MIGSALHTVIRIGRLLSTTCTLGWPSDFYPLSRQDFCFGWYWILLIGDLVLIKLTVVVKTA